MSHSTWVILGVVLAVVVIGFMVVNSTSFSKLGTTQSNPSTLTNVASIFKSTGSIFGDVEKAFPSWFDNSPDPTADNLNSYASSSGFGQLAVDAN